MIGPLRRVMMTLALAVLALGAAAACAHATLVLGALGGSGTCLLRAGAPAIAGCARVPALDGVIVASPDGRDVYIGSFFDVRLVLLRRNPRTGAVHEAAGINGCFGGPSTYQPRLRCRRPAYHIGGPVDALAISPNGRWLYMSQSGVLTVLRRDPRTGLVSSVRASGGCLADIGSKVRGCSPVLHGVGALAASPDGRSLYTGGYESIDVLHIDPHDGTLHPLAGKRACLGENPRNSDDRGCTDARGLGGVEAITVAPDGKDVYVAAPESHGIGAFRRAPSGALTQTVQYPCLTEDAGDPFSPDGAPGACQDGKALDGPLALVVSPDGRRIYVASDGQNGTAVADSGALSVILRDPRTGAIRQGPCLTTDGTDPSDPDRGTCAALALIGDPADIALTDGGGTLLLGTSAVLGPANLSRSLVLALPVAGGDPVPTGFACVADGVPPACAVAPSIGTELALEPGGHQITTLQEDHLQVLHLQG